MPSQRKGVLHNLVLMTWMPLHTALIYTTAVLFSNSPKDRPWITGTVVVASMLASSTASIAVKRLAASLEVDHAPRSPVSAFDRVFTIIPFALFSISFVLMMAHLLQF